MDLSIEFNKYSICHSYICFREIKDTCKLEPSFNFNSLLFISLSQEMDIILKLVCVLLIYVLYFIIHVYTHINKMPYVMYYIFLSGNAVAQNYVFTFDSWKPNLHISITEFYEYVKICLLPNSCV